MKTSKGEQRVIDILKSNSISFRREQTFAGMKSSKGNPLRVDFYLPLFKIAIEFDGEQHFKRNKHFHKTTNQFQKGQFNDLQKNSYCLMNGIKLYRIPYYEIDNIVNLDSLFNEQYLVKTKWHNYDIINGVR